MGRSILLLIWEWYLSSHLTHGKKVINSPTNILLMNHDYILFLFFFLYLFFFYNFAACLLIWIPPKFLSSVFTEKMDLDLPSGLVNSLKVGKEMKVWDTECVGSRTQATSLGWQVFIQRKLSERWCLATLKEKTNIHTHKKENTKTHTWPLTFR